VKPEIRYGYKKELWCLSRFRDQAAE